MHKSKNSEIRELTQKAGKKGTLHLFPKPMDLNRHQHC